MEPFTDDQLCLNPADWPHGLTLQDLTILEDCSSYWGDLWKEQQVHADYSLRAANWLINAPRHVSRRQHLMTVRCPVKGCNLADVFHLPRRDGGEHYLAITNTSASKKRGHAGLLNWCFSDDWRGPRVYYPASCRHGHARLERVWLLESGELMTYDDDAHSRLMRGIPEDDLRRRRRGVFNPKATAWHPKIRRAAGGTINATRS